jgi:hypothetical protein
MNISKGIYRVAQAIKWVGRVLGGLWFLAMAYALTATRTSEDGFILLVSSVVFVGITEGIAWVLEGFTDE